MDWYSIVKFAHVFAAILWLGGGFTILIMGALAERSGPDAMLANLKTTNALGLLLFMPASLATLITGLVMATVWTGFSDLWIIIGMAGAAWTFVTGAFFIKPVGEKIQALVETEGMSPAVLEMGRRLTRVARFDYAVMVVIIADMVMKPGWGDYAILGAMAAWLILAAVYLNLPRSEHGAPAAA
ncbi:MAG TPA: DUF2269 family protein [Rhizobiaceae bacterium]|nr:DUF2269 family protein [Rhizobiaceae bacterium]